MDFDQGVKQVSMSAYARDVFLSNLRELAPFLDDPTVQEIMINRHDDVWIERAGHMARVEGLILNTGRLEGALKSLATANEKDLAAVMDCRMPGLRIAAAQSPVGVNGSTMCIRKHSKSDRVLTDYLAQGGFGPLPEHLKDDDLHGRPGDADIAQGGEALAQFFRWMMVKRKNFLIAGGTSSGKTTFLNALLREIPEQHRVLTIEDTSELQVVCPNYVGFEAIGSLGITIRDLIRLALRYRPDRIFVGEVRGGEAYDLMDALNTGHSGGACSLHADSPEESLVKLESYMRQSTTASSMPHIVMREQIASTFDYIIYCTRRGTRRGPERVMRLDGMTGSEYMTTTIFDARNI
jgi:pilus assembly protein CpaF